MEILTFFYVLRLQNVFRLLLVELAKYLFVSSIFPNIMSESYIFPHDVWKDKCNLHYFMACPFTPFSIIPCNLHIQYKLISIKQTNIGHLIRILNRPILFRQKENLFSCIVLEQWSSNIFMPRAKEPKFILQRNKIAYKQIWQHWPERVYFGCFL